MEKISLKLFTDKINVLEGESNLKKVGDKYYFRIKDSNYMLNIPLKTLIKKNNESIIQIDLIYKKMSISLLNTPGELNIDFMDSSFNYNDNNINIKYKYELDGITEQEIDINLY